MTDEPVEIDRLPPSQKLAGAAVARVLGEISSVRPVSIDYQSLKSGDVIARIMFDDELNEIECRLSSEGNLIAARLLER